MASDKIRFAVSATPIEEVGTSSEGTVSTFIAASECYGSVGGSGEVTGLDIISGAGDGDGYDDSARYYHNALKVAEVTAGAAVTTYDLGVMDATTGIEFLYIKHSGFEGDSSGAKSTTVNTADVLSVMAAFANNQYITIARLKSGEAIVLPVRSKAGTPIDGIKFLVCSSDGVAIDGTIGIQGTIAVEYLAIGA